MLRKVCRIGLPLLLVLALGLSSTALAIRPSEPQKILALAYINDDRVEVYWQDPEVGDPILDYQISLDGVNWTSIGLVHTYVFDNLDVYQNKVDLYLRAVNADGPGEFKMFLTYAPAVPGHDYPIGGEPAYFPTDMTGYKVLTASLEVRSGAGTEFEVIDSIPSGAILKWIDWDSTGDWWRLLYNDGESAGWVQRTSVKWKNAAYPEIR